MKGPPKPVERRARKRRGGVCAWWLWWWQVTRLERPFLGAKGKCAESGSVVGGIILGLGTALRAGSVGKMQTRSAASLSLACSLRGRWGIRSHSQCSTENMVNAACPGGSPKTLHFYASCCFLSCCTWLTPEHPSVMGWIVWLSKALRCHLPSPT